MVETADGRNSRWARHSTPRSGTVVATALVEAHEENRRKRRRGDDLEVTAPREHLEGVGGPEVGGPFGTLGGSAEIAHRDPDHQRARRRRHQHRQRHLPPPPRPRPRPAVPQQRCRRRGDRERRERRGGLCATAGERRAESGDMAGTTSNWDLQASDQPPADVRHTCRATHAHTHTDGCRLGGGGAMNARRQQRVGCEPKWPKRRMRAQAANASDASPSGIQGMLRMWSVVRTSSQTRSILLWRRRSSAAWTHQSQHRHRSGKA